MTIQQQVTKTNKQHTSSRRGRYLLSSRWQSLLRRRANWSFWRCTDTTRHCWRDGAQGLSSTCCHRIVVMQVVVGIKKLFKPLDKLKIVLESAFWQLLDGNNLHKKQHRRDNSQETTVTSNSEQNPYVLSVTANSLFKISKFSLPWQQGSVWAKFQCTTSKTPCFVQDLWLSCHI